jgi:cell division protein FtsB
MDMTAIAAMITSVVLVALIGGIIMLAPITRRLALLLEQKLQDRQSGQSSDEVRALRQRMQFVEEELRILNERQQFTEELIAQRRTRALAEPSDTAH